MFSYSKSEKRFFFPKLKQNIPIYTTRQKQITFFSKLKTGCTKSNDDMFDLLKMLAAWLYIALTLSKLLTHRTYMHIVIVCQREDKAFCVVASNQ